MTVRVPDHSFGAHASLLASLINTPSRRVAFMVDPSHEDQGLYQASVLLQQLVNATGAGPSSLVLDSTFDSAEKLERVTAVLLSMCNQVCIRAMCTGFVAALTLHMTPTTECFGLEDVGRSMSGARVALVNAPECMLYARVVADVDVVMCASKVRRASIGRAERVLGERSEYWASGASRKLGFEGTTYDASR